MGAPADPRLPATLTVQPHGAFLRPPCRRKVRHGAPGFLSRAVRSSSDWENRCPCPFDGVTWASTIESVAPKGVYLGKIGSGSSVLTTARSRTSSRPGAYTDRGLAGWLMIQSVLVLGGGSAGFLVAITLKHRHPDMRVPCF